MLKKHKNAYNKSICNNFFGDVSLIRKNKMQRIY